jgi:hypothetical protein
MEVALVDDGVQSAITGEIDLGDRLALIKSTVFVALTGPTRLRNDRRARIGGQSGTTDIVGLS